MYILGLIPPNPTELDRAVLIAVYSGILLIFVGLKYNSSDEAMEQALKVSVRIWAMGLNAIAKDRLRYNTLKMYPYNSCNATTSGQFWKDGGYLYRYLPKRFKNISSSVSIQPRATSGPPVKSHLNEAKSINK